MIKKGNLILLIKSLTKAEKRYFRVFAAAGKSNKNYLILFDFIDIHDPCDDKIIRSHFKNKTFVKQLHVTKIYLNNLILKSLRNFHGKASKGAELNELMHDIEILFKKELFAQCEITINKALRLAQEYEKYNYLLEICAWKRKLLLAKIGPEHRKNSINEILSLEKEAIDKIANLNSYWNLTINLFDVIGANSTNSMELENYTLLKSKSQANSMQARILYYHNLYTYYLMKGNLSKGEKCLNDLIAYLEKRPEKIKDDPSSYITALNNKIAFYLQTKRLEAIPGLLAKVKAVPKTYGMKKQTPGTIKLLLHTYNVELEMCRDSGQHREGILLAQEVAKFLEDHHKSIPADYRLLLYYQFAYLHFMNEDYANTLHWLNEIFRQNFGRLREDIQSFAHLLGLIVHFELGNIIVLKYTVDSCRRFLRKKRNLYPFEKVLLRFFSKISMATPDKYQDLFKRLDEELFLQTAEQAAKNALDYLDFKKWIRKNLKRH